MTSSPATASASPSPLPSRDRPAGLVSRARKRSWAPRSRSNSRPPAGARPRPPLAAVLAEMHRIDARDEPAPGRIPASPASTPQAAPLRSIPAREMFDLLTRARALSKPSGGAFDITFASAGHSTTTAPASRPTRRAGRSAAADRLAPREAGRRPPARVRFARPGVRIDLGGFAKGHAVDNAVAILRRLGIAHAMVAAGGDSHVMGLARRPPMDGGDPRPPPGRRRGGAPAAGRRVDLDLRRLRALLRARRRALPSPARPAHRQVAAAACAA